MTFYFHISIVLFYLISFYISFFFFFSLVIRYLNVSRLSIYHLYIYIYVCLRMYWKITLWYMCSGPNLELQVILAALKPQVSEYLESTDKDLEFALLALLRKKNPSCFGEVLWYSQLVWIWYSGLGSQLCHSYVLIFEKESFFIISVKEKWAYSWNMYASVCVHK